MRKRRTIAIIVCLLGLAAGGCGQTSLPASNARVVELRRALYGYMMSPGHEPIDPPENQDRILALLKSIEPLDGAEKINIALDTFEYYDATDNRAGPYARELLVKYGNLSLPYVIDRVRLARNPDEIKNLIRDIEGS